MFMALVLYTKALQQYLPEGPYSPAYEGESVGLDLYAVEDREIWPVTELHVRELASQLIPTGIHLILKSSEVGLILERGSVVKTQLKVRAGVIDPGFTGQVFVNCVNLGTHPHLIQAGTKLPFQLVVTPIVRPTMALVEDINAELARIKTNRRAGQIGSSDQDPSPMHICSPGTE